MAAGQIVLVGGGEEARREVVVAPVHLDGNIMSMIVSKLPSKPAYRFGAVSKPSRALLSEPSFLQRHLSPPPPPLVDDLPGMLVVRPKGLRSGYTHLTIVSTDPNNPFTLNLPVHRDYEHLAEHAPPADAASTVEEDFVTFFQQTIPMLDASVVASDGRMLLARNPNGSYYVCLPAANRWIALPPAPVALDRDTAVGFHYDVVDATRRTISFTVVLLTGVLVATFSSNTGRWETEALGMHDDAALCLGTASPGIHAGNCIYWLGASSDHSRVLCFDMIGSGGASFIDEPPRAKGPTKRVGRSLGSAGGRLRLCAFDIRDDEPQNKQPHAIEGVHGVWLLGDAGAWQRVHEVDVDDMSVHFFNLPLGPEMPIDFSGASGYAIIVNKHQTLLRRDLGSGEKVELFCLYKHKYGRMAELYRQFDVFPLFK